MIEGCPELANESARMTLEALSVRTEVVSNTATGRRLEKQAILKFRGLETESSHDQRAAACCWRLVERTWFVPDQSEGPGDDLYAGHNFESVAIWSDDDGPRPEGGAPAECNKV